MLPLAPFSTSLDSTALMSKNSCTAARAGWAQPRASRLRRAVRPCEVFSIVVGGDSSAFFELSERRRVDLRHFA